MALSKEEKQFLKKLNKAFPVCRSNLDDSFCKEISALYIKQPDEIRNIDISLKDDYPGLIEVLVEMLKNFSVEKAVIAEETKNIILKCLKI